MVHTVEFCTFELLRFNLEAGAVMVIRVSWWLNAAHR